MNNLFRDRFQPFILANGYQSGIYGMKNPTDLCYKDQTERLLLDRAVSNKALYDDVVRRITIAYNVARQAPKIPLPRNVT